MASTFNKSTLEAQDRLLRISRSDPDIPRVNPDGIYGPATSAAVAAFQKKHGLKVTGKIDYGTWNSIIEAYRKNEAEHGEIKSISPFSSPLENSSLSPGNVSDLVAVMQHMLAHVGIEFNTVGALPITGIYDLATQNAVSAIQARGGIPVTGIADKPTLNLLSELYQRSLGKTK